MCMGWEIGKFQLPDLGKGWGVWNFFFLNEISTSVAIFSSRCILFSVNCCLHSWTFIVGSVLLIVPLLFYLPIPTKVSASFFSAKSIIWNFCFTVLQVSLLSHFRCSWGFMTTPSPFVYLFYCHFSRILEEMVVEKFIFSYLMEFKCLN